MKKFFYIALFICATSFTGCSEDFWAGFDAGYNAWNAPQHTDTACETTPETNNSEIN